MKITPKLLLILVLGMFSKVGLAFTLETVNVVDNVYALIGEIGPRTPDNLLLNNTQGFIETETGIILISTGASPQGAKLIEQTIKKTTSKPIKWIINVGSQDHHWMGNGYFIIKGAKSFALAKTITNQKIHTDTHMTRLKTVMAKNYQAFIPKHAKTAFKADDNSLNIDGIKLHLIWPGNGHFPGDGVLYYPAKKVVFSGDFIYNDRLLGVQPYSKVVEWQKSFHNIMKLDLNHIVPGHGYPSDKQGVIKSTGNYLDFLIINVKAAVDDWKELAETVDKLSDAPQFAYLKFYDSWHKRNINRTFIELEGAP